MIITPTQIEAIYKLVSDKAKADRLIMLAKRNDTIDFANMLKNAMFENSQEEALIKEFLDSALKQDENHRFVNSILHNAVLGFKDLDGNDICPECNHIVPSGSVDYVFSLGRRMCRDCKNKLTKPVSKALLKSAIDKYNNNINTDYIELDDDDEE